MDKHLKLFARPKIFIVGVCLGILLCSFAGRRIAAESHYENFVRIGGAHSTGTAFFVTASQISALIRKTCRHDQILVLAGGSSVIMGSGQPIRYLWTKKLQEKLGPEYCVFNLATPAGGLAGYASVSMEMVGKEFKNAFLVSDSNIPPFDPDGMIWYKHFFWDAYYKGLLKNSPVNYSDERISRINETHFRADSKTKARIEQLKIGMWLDSLLYFNDLWSFVHYTIGQTIYDPLAGPYNWKPRRNGADYDYEVNEEQVRTLQHYPAPDSPQFAGEFNVVRSFRGPYFETMSGKQLISEKVMMDTDRFIHNYPLTDVAGQIVIAIIPESSYYRMRLPENDQRDYVELRKRFAKTWEHNGYNTVVMDELGPEDYGDRVHIDTFGGWKLAEKVSETIRALAEKPKNNFSGAYRGYK